MYKHLLSTISISFVIAVMAVKVSAQPYATIDLDKDKPQQYENRKLQSEKTGDKKLTNTGRLFQNAFTHYNYYFNANNKVNEIIARAKAAHKDDYLQLLSFYNYSLDATASSKRDIDSIVYKCTCGILLHDLRNDWIDNLYLTLGKAYLLKQQFDSAAYIFQYINYAWAPKDDGYDIPIGSNASNTNGVFTISTNEKRSIGKKLISTLPSRNESFIWQARNYLEQDMVGEAYGLLSILRSDPNFPTRLQSQLHEMFAYAYYKQEAYDSAAWHLSRALDDADGRLETARWEYLCGQLYNLAGKTTDAVDMFERSIKHTTDPLMEVYANISIINITASKTNNALQERLIALYKLAKRDKYEEFRDMMYYAIATLELKQNNYAGAESALMKSLQYNVNNPQQRHKSFLLLADVHYLASAFHPSYNYYDSTQASYFKGSDKERLTLRKPALKIITTNLSAIEKEDSLQKIAAMTDAERKAYVRKLLRQLRKAQGLKDADDGADYGSSIASKTTTDLFGTANTDFYFQNTSQKQKGYTDFKVRWGNRPNVDNWQRQAAARTPITPTASMMDVDKVPGGAAGKDKAADLSFDGLMKNIPLTDAKLDASNTVIGKGLFENGVIFQDQLENYPAAINSYNELLRRFHNYGNADQVLFNLAYCYNHLGLTSKSDSVATVLKSSFPKSKYTALLLNKNAPANKTDAVTETYQKVYNLFIEGDFEKAKVEKQKADNQFGKSYWTPQLLYIESIYYIRQRQDSIAINRLENLAKTFPTTPLAEKARTMVNVLKRRNEIEKYLTNLEIHDKDDINRGVDLDSINVVATRYKRLYRDSIGRTLSAHNTSAPVQPVIVPPVTKPVTPPVDSAAIVAKPAAVTNKLYSFNPDEPQSVAVILDKVDDVFAREAANAFNRYNTQNASQKISLSSVTINDQYKLVVLSGFTNATEAISYIDKTKPQAGTRIVPWLQASKYSFIIISDSNLSVLKTNKDMGGYTQYLKELYPNKF